jgi:mannose/fructose/N-acetylgalactosamine-specific phosphotransferase system component IIB
MAIVFARIDNRLIHGQVLEAWVPITRANCIVVASNDLPELSFQRQLMKAAVPSGIEVAIGSVEEMVDFLNSGEASRRRIFLLFGNLRDALEAFHQGIHFPTLNLGNLHGGKDLKRLSCTVALDRDDVAYLETLEKEGVRVVLQCVPSDRQRYWRSTT